MHNPDTWHGYTLIKEDPKIDKSQNTPLEFCWHQHFFTENQQVLLYFVISFDWNYIVDVIKWPKFGNSSASKDLSRKNNFLKGCSCFKFNNLGLACGMALKFYTNVAKGFELKVRKFWRLIPTFVEVTGKAKIWGLFAFQPLPPSWVGSFLYQWLILQNIHITTDKNSHQIPGISSETWNQIKIKFN